MSDQDYIGNALEGEIMGADTDSARTATEGRRSTHRPDGLTPSQRQFASAVVQGKGMLEAYKSAYNVAPGTKDRSVYSNANKLIRNPKVQAFVERQNREIVQREQRSAGERRHWIVQRLMHEAEHAEADATRVRALELLGKMYDVRLFTDQIDVDDNRQSSIDLHMQIASRLESLLPKVKDEE